MQKKTFFADDRKESTNLILLKIKVRRFSGSRTSVENISDPIFQPPTPRIIFRFGFKLLRALSRRKVSSFWRKKGRHDRLVDVISVVTFVIGFNRFQL